MYDIIFKVLTLSIGGFIMYKLHDIKKEIEYFECQKNVSLTRKEYEQIYNKKESK